MPLCLPDTSCLIHLERIEHLDLLHGLYEEVRIPPAVRTEYGGVPEGIDVASAPNPALIHLLRRTVDAGEAELIALGTELDGHVVLDDAAARTEARDLGLTVVGTVGIILRAKQTGHISAVRPLLDALRGTGFWMSDELYRHALRRAGEEK
jgi:predicted nucleic acid-binding protein